MLTVKISLHLVSDHEGKRVLSVLSDVFYCGNKQDSFFMVSVNSCFAFSYSKLIPASRKQGVTRSQHCFRCVSVEDGKKRSFNSPSRESTSSLHLCSKILIYHHSYYHKINNISNVYLARKIKKPNEKNNILFPIMSLQMYKLFFWFYHTCRTSLLLVQRVVGGDHHLFSGAILFEYFQDRSARYKYKCVENCWNGNQVYKGKLISPHLGYVWPFIFNSYFLKTERRFYEVTNFTKQQIHMLFVAVYEMSRLAGLQACSFHHFSSFAQRLILIAPSAHANLFPGRLLFLDCFLLWRHLLIRLLQVLF